jgi:hypothetical protein
MGPSGRETKIIKNVFPVSLSLLHSRRHDHHHHHHHIPHPMLDTTTNQAAVAGVAVTGAPAALESDSPGVL